MKILDTLFSPSSSLSVSLYDFPHCLFLWEQESSMYKQDISIHAFVCLWH